MQGDVSQEKNPELGGFNTLQCTVGKLAPSEETLFHLSRLLSTLSYAQGRGQGMNEARTVRGAQGSW